MITDTIRKASVLEATASLVSCSENGQEQLRQLETRVTSEATLKASVLETAPSSVSCSKTGQEQVHQFETRVTTEATLNASVLETAPSLVSCSENGLGHHAWEYSSSILLGGDGPVVHTLEQTQKSDVPVSYISSAISNCEPLSSTFSLPSNEELKEMQNLHFSASSNHMNGLPLGEVRMELEGSFPFSESVISEETKNLDLPASYHPSTTAILEPLASAIHDPNLNLSDIANHMNGPHLTSDAVGPFFGGDFQMPRACGDDTGKPGHDELQYVFTDASLSAELENIWRQHSSGGHEQSIMQSLHSQGNEQMTLEGGSEKAVQDVDSSLTGVTAVEPGRNGTLLDGPGVEESKLISLALAEPGLNGDIAVPAVLTSPRKPSSKQPSSEQRDAPVVSLEKRGDALHPESRGSEKEVDFLSTVTQMSACSYTNKYANSDLVATAAFNLAVMAGGVDDLVDDKTGPAKKSKPSSAADQMRAFTQASSHFYWPNVKKRAKDVPKEKCGWCINCRSTGRRGCLLTQVAGQMAGGAALVVGGIRPIKGGSGHFPAVAAYILYMEENLHGLLMGPWEFAGHRKKWRKQVEQATSVKDIRLALLEV